MKASLFLIAFPAVLAAAKLPSSVTVLSSPNPSVYGRPTTLTASVTPSLATGAVTFYDGTSVLGTSPLSNGQAALTTVLPAAGNRSLKAYYAGDAMYSPSVSPLSAQTVNSLPSLTFGPAATYSLGGFINGPTSAVTGDFNGDGKTDLAVAGWRLNILLGSGDGTFRPLVQYQLNNAGFATAYGIAVGDLNADGKLDVAVMDGQSGAVNVFLGNGDGTFQKPVNYTAGGESSDPRTLALGDFNNDGRADLVVGSALGAYLLPGNGDGTFQSAVKVASSAPYVAIADFNQDGNTDLIISNNGASLRVLLGNGNGTFQPAIDNPSGNATAIPTLADLNGDGRTDVVLISGDGVSVLLGRGDGTFLTARTFATGPGPQFLAVGDVDGDGKLDLIVAIAGDGSGGAASVLLGNADGTFGIPAMYNPSPLGRAPGAASVTVGDFNGDGRTDIAASPFSGTAESILLGSDAGPSLSISKVHTGNLRQSQTGASYTITVSNVGNAATFGTVLVVDNLPRDLTATSVTGTGWTCMLSTVSCTRDDTLPPGGTFAAITIIVNVAYDAAQVVTNTATVSGGGGNNLTNSTASDPANVLLAPIAGRIANAADGSVQPLARGTIASLSGTNLAYVMAQVSGAPWPLTLGNVTVRVNGIAAPLQMVSPGKIVFQIPYEIDDTMTASVTVTNEGGQSQQTFPDTAHASPGIFAGSIRNADTALNSATQPAAAGSSVTVFFTGAGTFAPPVADGAAGVSSPVSIPTQPTGALIGAATGAILAAVAAPGMVGVTQAVILIPASIASGSYPLVVTSGGIRSAPATVYVGGQAPTITSQVPDNAPAGSASAVIAVNTLNAGGGAAVFFQAPGGQPVPIAAPQFPSTPAQAGEFIVVVPQTLLHSPGPAQITVVSGLGVSSNPVPFYITPFTINTITPNNAKAGAAAATVTISGPNFAGAVNLFFTPPGGSPVALPLTLLQTNAVQANIPAALLVSAGVAKIALANADSALSNALVFTIQPSQTTNTSLASSSNPGVFGHAITLTATVAPSAATGNVTFYDGTTVLGTGPLVNGRTAFTTSLIAAGARSLSARYAGDPHNGPSTSQLLTQVVNAYADSGFLAPVVYPSRAVQAATGDFNGDGRSDLVTVDSVVGVMLGNGDGTFQASIDTSIGAAIKSVVVADFDLDGKADVAVTSSLGVTVLLGNGDGTFQPAKNLAGAAGAMAVGDFNGDGKPDLAVTDAALGGVEVLLGNGDGTFQPSLFCATGPAYFVLTGDFNGDSIADLAVSVIPDYGAPGKGMTVLLGRGDGTFAPALASIPDPSSGFGSFFTAGDFNGDGKLDLAGPAPNSVYVLLGKGDGTFGPPTRFASTPPGSFPTSIATGDFNGDGKTDLVIGEYINYTNDCFPVCYGAIGVIPGKGDGTFLTSAQYAFPSQPRSMVVADFNGDGRPDIATEGVYVLLGTSGQSTQTISFSPFDDAISTTRMFDVQVTASSGLPPALVSTTPDVCTVSGHVGTILAPGRCSITATQTGNTIYAAAASVTQTFAIHDAAANEPVVLSGGINSLFRSSTVIEPGSWISIYGTNLSSAAATWNGDFPTSLGGVTVTINGRRGYLWYVSPTQINLQAPDDSPTGVVSVTVANPAGTWRSEVTLGPISPSFSLLDTKHAAAIILRFDGSGTYGGGTYDVAGPTGATLGYPTVAAKQGDVVELFGVGFGPTSPRVLAGRAFSGAAPTTNQVQLTIGGIPVTPSFAGVSSAGLYQINLTVPAGLGTGDQTVVATVGGVRTQSGVVIALQ